MNAIGLLQIALYLAALVLLARPLGEFMARVYQAKRLPVLDQILGPIERAIYRLAGVARSDEMNWKQYAAAVLMFSLLGTVAVYSLQRVQHLLPLNPQGQSAVAPDLAFNTATSFATNTNWQSYSGETTLSYLTQMTALTVQNFVSAAAGMAVLVALIRGISRRTTRTIGSFWVDMTRSTLYILLPLSLVLALVIVSQGVVQTFSPYKTVDLVQTSTDAAGQPF